ncbi:hypothetical protein NIGALANA_9 [Bacillus phage Nigalana]|uniref:hypothetical protein n=1 Tax=Bacillus phage Nigalana TaxID=1805951 RepID=UPI0007A77146|nr:hypothetical protein BI005_gp009 [Bacillus phage Nigalana]AMW61164.1 hypothetical protein NIGALANA_9 [Bacillus phage Nigalana]
MTRHTRNKQLRDLNKEMYENYEINMKMPTSIMFEKGAGTLDKDFWWHRNQRAMVSVDRWKKKRFNRKERFKVHMEVENLIFFGKNGCVRSKYN